MSSFLRNDRETGVDEIFSASLYTTATFSVSSGARHPRGSKTPLLILLLSQMTLVSDVVKNYIAPLVEKLIENTTRNEQLIFSRAFLKF